jgi:hypothetical protein
MSLIAAQFDFAQSTLGFRSAHKLAPTRAGACPVLDQASGRTRAIPIKEPWRRLVCLIVAIIKQQQEEFNKNYVPEKGRVTGRWREDTAVRMLSTSRQKRKKE